MEIMEQQIYQAVDIGLNPCIDADLKVQAVKFINEVKKSEEGYNTCFLIICRSLNEKIEDKYIFFAFQVIEENVGRVCESELFRLKNEILMFIEEELTKKKNYSMHLRNKVTHILGKMFCHMYLGCDSMFLKDIVSRFTSSEVGVDYCIKIMIAIHFEIGDKHRNENGEILERNRLIKDRMRAQDMDDMVSFWYRVLTNFSDNNDIISNTLKVIGYYVEWMDICLFVRKDFIYSIRLYIKKPNTRNSAFLALRELISKKMKPVPKMQLLSFFSFNSTIDFTETDLNDEIYLECLSKFKSQHGLELLKLLENNKEKELLDELNAQLQKLWDIILRLYDNYSENVYQSVFSFIKNFLTLCKKNIEIYSTDLIMTLLNKTMMMMKVKNDDFDSYSSFCDSKRKELILIQNKISVLIPDLYLDQLITLIENSLFQNTDSADWKKLELGLIQLNNYIDSLKNNILNLKKNEFINNKYFLILKTFLTQLLESDSLLFLNNKINQILFFNLITSDLKFLKTIFNQSEYQNKILSLLISSYGLFSTDYDIKYKTAILTLKFIKTFKNELNFGAFGESLILKLQPMLKIDSKTLNQDSNSETNTNDFFAFQLCLYEIVGIITTYLPQKLNVVDSLFQMNFNDLEICIKTNSDNMGTQNNAAHIKYLLMTLGTFLKGINENLTNEFKILLQEKINYFSEIVLFTLKTFLNCKIVRNSLIFAFSKIILISNKGFSEFFSTILSTDFLELDEITSLFGLLTHTVYQSKTDPSIYFLLNSIMSPLIINTFQTIDKFQSDLSSTDIKIQHDNLKKAFGNFVASLISNHVSSLLISNENKELFPRILNNLFIYSTQISDFQIAKLSMSTLINVVIYFDNHGSLLDNKDIYSSLSAPVDGINDFLSKNITKLVFDLSFSNIYSTSDIHGLENLYELMSILIKKFYEKNKSNYSSYLYSALVNMGMNQDLFNNFLYNLELLDENSFKSYFIKHVYDMKINK